MAFLIRGPYVPLRGKGTFGRATQGGAQLTTTFKTSTRGACRCHGGKQGVRAVQSSCGARTLGIQHSISNARSLHVFPHADERFCCDTTSYGKMLASSMLVCMNKIRSERRTKLIPVAIQKTASRLIESMGHSGSDHDSTFRRPSHNPAWPHTAPIVHTRP